MKSAFPQTQTTCKIRLYSNIPFDNSYQHHSLISDLFTYNNTDVFQGGTSSPACERFLDLRDYGTTGKPYKYPRYDLTNDYNFNFENGLLGSVTLELTNAQTNANYMRVTCGSDVYYYFITGIKQVNFETYTLSLELDVLMTYQDEFLLGIKNIPVFVERKHCHRYTNDGLMPHCADLRGNEETFSNVKPSVIESVTATHFKSANLKNFEGVIWAYICMDRMQHTISDLYTDLGYSFKSVPHPLAVACIPLNVYGFQLLHYHMEGEEEVITGVYSTNISKIKSVIRKAVGNGNIHSIRLSPYPPFRLDKEGVAVRKTLNVATGLYSYTISVKSDDVTTDGTGTRVWQDGKSTIKFTNAGDEDVDDVMFITDEFVSDITLDDVTLGGIANNSAPTIDSNRYLDPKLLFKPFKSYKIASCYGAYEFFPELLYSRGVFANSKVSFKSIACCYVGDNTYYTYLNYKTDSNSSVIIENQNYDNIGLSANTNYVLPAGTNALDVFNTTQANSFYQSKTASGISAGLTIAGGVASTGLGILGMIGTLGLSTPASIGLIAGGATAVGSGIAGMANTIKSTNAKVEDLKNTPDSFNVAGSCFTSDLGRTSTLYPYVLVYTCSEDIIKRADDFFYSYGYSVSRECYFNLELKFDNNVSKNTDNNIFGRTIFNFVQTNEDITNKIDANIPLLIKQKISTIFRNGITLWNFFGFGGLWDNNEPEDSYYVNNWFMKCALDNTEYDGTRYN